MQTAIRGMVGAGATNPKEASTTADVEKITKTAGQEKASVSVTRPTGEKVEVDARPGGAKDTTGDPIIILEGDSESAQNRAFRPAANDKSLVIEMAASFRRAASGARLRWSAPQAGTISIDNPDAARTKVRGIVPGVHDLDVDLLDGGGTRIASMKLKLSVPQCVQLKGECGGLRPGAHRRAAARPEGGRDRGVQEGRGGAALDEQHPGVLAGRRPQRGPARPRPGGPT